MSSDSYDEDRERQLEIVNEKFQNLFKSKEKIYGNIIKEINAEKKLFFKKSIMSFNLLVLKIKCLIKLLKGKFVESLTMKEYYELDPYIHRIKKDFKNLYTFINEESKLEYELITQVYAKFLYLMGIICTKKEEYITSFSYVSLGVNILKVFFVREGIATQIETYQIYAKLIIMLINKLIADNNVSQALIHINLLTRICEIGLTLVSENKAEIKYEFKFFRYQSYGFLYMGYCYELMTKTPNNYKIALKAYKEAYYFMNKTPYKATIFAELSNVITIERKPLYLAQILFEKITEKLTVEAIEKQKEFEKKEILKKQKLEEARNEEKKNRLKLIASGVTPENSNLSKIQEKIFNEILTPNNQVLMDKLDDELISYVYRKKIDKENEKEEAKKEKKDKKEENEISNKMPSMETMKNLCHYKMYHNLMSDDYKEFLLHNRQLLFNSPNREKNSLDKIQKFLNRKMAIDTKNSNAENKEKKIEKKNVKENNNLILKTENEANISTESNRIFKKTEKDSINNINIINNNDIKLIIENNKNNNENKDTTNINNIKSNQKKINLFKTYQKSNHSYIISKEKDSFQTNKYQNKNHKKNLTFTNYTKSLLTTGNNIKIKQPLTAFRRFPAQSRRKKIENIKVDKFVFNKKYYKQLSYFENLINRELYFQKILLDQKGANSKMFLKGYQTELDNMGLVQREEVYNAFLILNDKVTSKERNYDKEMKLEIEFKNKPKVLGNMFKSVSQKMKEGKQIKSAVGRVLDKYLLAQKKQKEKRKNLKIDKKEIDRKNEMLLLKLNDNLKQIDYLEKSKIKEIKKIKNKILYGNNLTHE